ncbi:MAG TPA: class I SAM-dependent methyltransferase [Opitutaceae bacterium]
MTQPASPSHFDAQQAANYDDRWAPLAPLRDSLHLQIAMVLRELPSTAHLLCVGAGTGAEVLALARFYPEWRFTVVEPSLPMLEVCRRKATEAGIAARCTFHGGYVDTLPVTTAAFDAATVLLVSHFITDRATRTAFFREVAVRVRSGGWVITADLTTAPDGRQARLFPVWQQLLRHAGATAEQVQAMLAAYERDVSLLPERELEALLEAAGFADPVRFSQSLLIHAWFARRP